MADSKKAGEFFTYKGRPLVRCGDEIYYGNMEEPYVIRMQIKSKKEVNGEEIADRVTVQLMATDPYLSPRKQLVKSSEKSGLYLAMDIADIWLERALAKPNNLTNGAAAEIMRQPLVHAWIEKHKSPENEKSCPKRDSFCFGSNYAWFLS